MKNTPKGLYLRPSGQVAIVVPRNKSHPFKTLLELFDSNNENIDLSTCDEEDLLRLLNFIKEFKKMLKKER